MEQEWSDMLPICLP